MHTGLLLNIAKGFAEMSIIALLAGVFIPADVGPAGDSVEDLLLRHDRALFEDLDRYLRDRPGAEDAEGAYRALFDLATRRAWFDEAAPRARSYLDGPSAGPSVGAARLIAAVDEARSGRIRGAVVLYRELMDVLDPDRHASYAADLADTIADAATSTGDADAAMEVYDCFRDRFGGVAGVVEKVELERDRIALLGRPAPAIAGVDADGRPSSIDTPTDAYTLVVFVATWSVPCRAELTWLRDASRRFGPDRLRVVAVGLDGTPAALDAFLGDDTRSWVVVHAPTSGADWAGDFRVAGVPSTALIAPDGTVERLGLRGAAIERTLAELLGGTDRGPDPSVPDAPAQRR